MSVANYFDVLGRQEDEIRTLLTVTAAELRIPKDGSPEKTVEARPRKTPEDPDAISLRYTFLEVEGRSNDPDKISDQAKLRQRLLEVKAERKAQRTPQDDAVTIRHILFSEGRVEQLLSDLSEVHERMMQIKAVTSPLDEKVVERSFPTLAQSAKEKQTGRKKPAAAVKKVGNRKKSRELSTAVKGGPPVRKECGPN